jgi:hypothetical protein
MAAAADPKGHRIRRETASQYLKAAGIAVRPPGGWGRRAEKPAITGITDPNCNPKTNPENPSTKGKAKATSKPANEVITDPEVITDLNPFPRDEVGALHSEHATSPPTHASRKISANALCSAKRKAGRCSAYWDTARQLDLRAIKKFGLQTTEPEFKESTHVPSPDGAA